jgi:hypothetical protein
MTRVSTAGTATAVVIGVDEKAGCNGPSVVHRLYKVREGEARGDGDAEVVEVPAAEAPRATVPTIQDRLNEKTADTIGELEGHYDAFLKNPRYQFKPYDFLVANNVPQSQLTKYELLFQARFDELKTAFTKTDEQLSEGYSHYKIGDYKRIMSFIDQILNDIIQYRGVKRATKKVRAPKAPKAEVVPVVATTVVADVVSDADEYF